MSLLEKRASLRALLLRLITNLEMSNKLLIVRSDNMRGIL